MVIAAYVWISKGEGRYGIDFLGGHELVVRFPEKVGVDKVRTALSKGGAGDVIVKSYGLDGIDSKDFSLRLQGIKGKNLLNDTEMNNTESSQVQKFIVTALEKAGYKNIQVVSAEYIGPTVGAELRFRGLVATILGLIGILLYLMFRFELAFGVGAVVALMHDVVFSLGIYLLLGYTINMETLAAALTIVGYSVNDTIVIFDRVREEIYEDRPGSLSEIVNRAINAMLGRTLITHLLTTISVIALLVFGTGAIVDMSVFLFAGMVSGSYSTMYIASPVMIWWHKMRGGSEDL
jgi:preprotein translocase SecF subunit